MDLPSILLKQNLIHLPKSLQVSSDVVEDWHLNIFWTRGLIFLSHSFIPYLFFHTNPFLVILTCVNQLNNYTQILCTILWETILRFTSILLKQNLIHFQNLNRLSYTQKKRFTFLELNFTTKYVQQKMELIILT